MGWRPRPFTAGERGVASSLDSNRIKLRMEKLTIEEKGLDQSLGTAQSLIDFVEHILDNASDEELVTMREQVVNRIDAEVVKRGKESVPTRTLWRTLVLVVRCLLLKI